jgi:MEMO1 family protein
MEYPKIRPVSAFPIELDEGQYICLQDPHHYLEHPVLVSPEMFSVIQFFDGQHSCQDIQTAYRQRYGLSLYPEHIRQIIEQLDQYLLLDSPAFFQHLDHLRREFARLSVRPSSHQGKAYPETPQDVTRLLDSFFTAPDGPGPLPRQQPAAPADSAVRAIMAPHIDISAGGPTFAWAYQALAAAPRPDVFIILGTSHVEMQNLLALTTKAFETPLGRVETGQTIVNELNAHLPYDAFADELLHKTEHSIEFQVLFLQHLYGPQPITIVPILCGGLLHEMLALQQPVTETPQLQESVESLQQIMRTRAACLVASVDFSHIGLRYGETSAPTPAMLAKVEDIDRELLTALEHGEPTEFIGRLQQDRNASRVCGIVPLYLLLRLLEDTPGTLLHYDRAELGEGSFVTFASMVWK